MKCNDCGRPKGAGAYECAAHKGQPGAMCCLRYALTNHRLALAKAAAAIEALTARVAAMEDAGPRRLTPAQVTKSVAGQLAQSRSDSAKWVAEQETRDRLNTMRWLGTLEPNEGSEGDD